MFIIKVIFQCICEKARIFSLMLDCGTFLSILLTFRNVSLLFHKYLIWLLLPPASFPPSLLSLLLFSLSPPLSPLLPLSLCVLSLPCKLSLRCALPTRLSSVSSLLFEISQKHYIFIILTVSFINSSLRTLNLFFIQYLFALSLFSFLVCRFVSCLFSFALYCGWPIHMP